MFQFVAYSGAIDSRLKDLLVLGETRDAAGDAQHPQWIRTRELSERTSTTC